MTGIRALEGGRALPGNTLAQGSQGPDGGKRSMMVVSLEVDSTKVVGELDREQAESDHLSRRSMRSKAMRIG